jgi:hypothetical protein
MTQEVLKLILPLLENCVNSYGLKYERPAFVKAITVIKEALAQPEQEPVACDCNQGQVCHICDPITPSQRTWVGMTGEEKSEMWEISRAALPRYATYATLIQANLKEKNT